ncbi:MAG: prepilin-type N-terminal cleavage/methylation domain-containing protein [Pirellulaceae bacterium]|nr:prepilin-type N-terminal cleavage/methylation domain-containing protein [Pirellulaceae bacterium]
MSRSASAKVRGLTLLELVVVLGILAMLSTVAVRSLEPIADQARYQQTQDLLNALQRAIVHSAAPPSSGVLASATGFIPDTGVLPSNISELIAKPPAIIDRTLQSFDSDRDSVDDVNLISGWNGPYLSLGAGQTEIVDGWGRTPALFENSGVINITSLGSDGDSTAPEDGYRQDISVGVNILDCIGAVVFRLFDIDSQNGSRINPSPTGSQQLGVFFYGVNATGVDSGEIAEQLIVVDNSGSFEYRRDVTLVGTAAARAILWDDANNNDELDVGETIVRKSIVHYFTVQPRLDIRVEMELR